MNQEFISFLYALAITTILFVWAGGIFLTIMWFINRAERKDDKYYDPLYYHSGSIGGRVNPEPIKEKAVPPKGKGVINPFTGKKVDDE